MNFSYSKIKIFNQCPKKFEYQYIKKYKIEKVNEAAIRGKEIHTILENVVKYFNKENIDKNKLINLIKKYNYKNELKKFKKIIKKYDFEKITEKFFKLEIDEINLIGYIDLILKNDEKIIIIDYKTGKSYDFNQLKLYSLWAKKEFKEIKEIECKFIMLDDDFKEITKVFNEEDLKDFEKELKENIHKILKTKHFKKIKSPLCNYCPFKKYCDEEFVNFLNLKE